MNKLRRYYTAFHRYSRSKGFGIHSPFAFDFVLHVLRERYRYYAYDDIERRRRQVLSLVSSKTRRPHIISLKNAKMLFRIVCRFQPSVILQCGTSHGVSSSIMLDVDKSSRLIIHTGSNCHEEIFGITTAPYSSRIAGYRLLSDAITAYDNTRNDNIPFILITEVSDTDIPQLSDTVKKALTNEGVIIMRNISRSKSIRRLWNETTASMSHGMSFSNDRIGIIVGYNRLPRQHYSLWF